MFKAFSKTFPGASILAHFLWLLGFWWTRDGLNIVHASRFYSIGLGEACKIYLQAPTWTQRFPMQVVCCATLVVHHRNFWKFSITFESLVFGLKIEDPWSDGTCLSNLQSSVSNPGTTPSNVFEHLWHQCKPIKQIYTFIVIYIKIYLLLHIIYTYIYRETEREREFSKVRAGAHVYKNTLENNSVWR